MDNSTAIELKRLHEENIKLRKRIKELEEESTQDHATGLLNRKGFENAVLPLLKENDDHRRKDDLYVAEKKPNTLAYIDLDRLHDLNEAHGRQRADEVILCLANFLRNSFRDTDIIARLHQGNGDEFMVFLQGTSQEEAEELLMNLQSAFGIFTGERFAAEGINASFSFGLAQGHKTLEKLMNESEKNMKEDKRRRHVAR